MKRRAVAALFLTLSLAVTLSCRRGRSPAAARASVIALLGDEPVEEAGFAAYVKAASGEEPNQVSPPVASSLLDQYLEELLLERAVTDASPPARGATPEERRRDVISRVARIDSLTDAELRAEYDAHPERFVKPPLVRLAQLLLPSREKAELARRRLLQGDSWQEVSRSLSMAPNAASGGSIGLLTLQDLPSELEKAVEATPDGGLTPIIATEHGFHVLKVIERTGHGTIPFEQARPSLRLTLAEERSTAAVAQLVAASRQRRPPVVIEEHLPFPYVGSTPRFSLDSRP